MNKSLKLQCSLFDAGFIVETVANKYAHPISADFVAIQFPTSGN